LKNNYTIKIEGKDWESCLNKSFKKRSNTVSIPGFRKGKVTKDMYIKHFGVETLYMDAVDFALPMAYEKLLKDDSIKPAATPGVDIKNVDEKHLEVEFTIVTKPEVKLGKYTKLGIKKENAEVTDEEVAHEIEHLRSHYAEVTVKEDGVVEEGDTAIIDFEGFKNKEAFEGGKGENYPLEIGSHTFIPGFEEGIVGMAVGEEKDLNLTFPKEYPSEELAGKKVVFKVKVNEIKTKIYPELDEAFFEDLALEGVNSKETLEASVKEELAASKERTIEDKYIDEVLQKVVENAEFEMPEEMIQDEVDRMIKEFSEQLRMQGFELSQYLEMIRMDEEKLRNEMKTEANNRVSFRLVLEAVADKEKIEISDEDADKEADALSTRYGMEKEEFLKAFGGLDIVKYDLKVKKALEIVQK